MESSPPCSDSSSQNLIDGCFSTTLGLSNVSGSMDEEDLSLAIERDGKNSENIKKRMVSKAGDIMVEVRNVRTERWRFFVDMFTSLIHLKWRWVLFLFCFCYVASWLIFGCLWAILVTAYGPGYCVDQVTYCYMMNTHIVLIQKMLQIWKILLNQ